MQAAFAFWFVYDFATVESGEDTFASLSDLLQQMEDVFSYETRKPDFS